MSLTPSMYPGTVISRYLQRLVMQTEYSHLDSGPELWAAAGMGKP